MENGEEREERLYFKYVVRKRRHELLPSSGHSKEGFCRVLSSVPLAASIGMRSYLAYVDFSYLITALA